MYSLVGVDGNAYALMGYTRQAMEETGFSIQDIDKMLTEAMSSDYNHLIRVCSGYITRANRKLRLSGMEEDDD